MRIFVDTEFMEDGQTIELLSLGAYREDGVSFYVESADADFGHANPWVAENVIPHLRHPRRVVMSRGDLAASFREFVGVAPEFWADWGAYDWVAICQLYGTMMDLPNGWPMFIHDIRQLAESVGCPQVSDLVPDPEGQHNAAVDAATCFDRWAFLITEWRGR